jgi:hypothetical protein
MAFCGTAKSANMAPVVAIHGDIAYLQNGGYLDPTDRWLLPVPFIYCF